MELSLAASSAWDEDSDGADEEDFEESPADEETLDGWPGGLPLPPDGEGLVWLAAGGLAAFWLDFGLWVTEAVVPVRFWDDF